MLTLDLGGFGRGTLGYKTSVFPGGEIFFELDATPRAIETVNILTRLNSSNDIMRLIMAVDALRREHFDIDSCVIPYIAYMQDDRVCAPGRAFSLKVVAKLLNDLKIPTIFTYDTHSNMSTALIDNLEDRGNGGFIQKVVSIISREIDISYKDLNIISPDYGASKKIFPLLSSVIPSMENNRVFICSKERDTSTNKLTKTIVPIIDNDNPCLIVDDICIGAGTFKNIVDKIRENDNSNEIYLACTHAPFSVDPQSLRPYFKHIFISNSRNDDFMVNGPKYTDLITQIPLF